MPKVSIVMPSFNQAQFLEAAVQSVLAQDYPNIEFMIMDGGSSDHSVQIIKKYADRITHWVSEPDGGQSHALNKGFRLASGDIFYWLNSDDIMMPSAAKIAVACLLSNPDIGMIYGDRAVIDAKGNMLPTVTLPSFSKSWMKYNLKIPQETVFFRRSLFERVGGLNETLHYCMDYDLWIRFNVLAGIHHVPFVLGAYRHHPAAKSVQRVAAKSPMRMEVEAVHRMHFGWARRRWLKKIYNLYEMFRRWLELSCSARTKQINQILRLIQNPLGVNDSERDRID